MNKQLLVTFFAVTFSGIICATETPDYTFFPAHSSTYCQENNTENCQKLALLRTTFDAALQTREVKELTPEELAEGNFLVKALHEEIALFNASKAPNILDNVEKDIKNIQELGEALGTADSKE